MYTDMYMYYKLVLYVYIGVCCIRTIQFMNRTFRGKRVSEIGCTESMTTQVSMKT